jgi:DASS family divalent anion:Na+ symporter
MEKLEIAVPAKSAQVPWRWASVLLPAALLYLAPLPGLEAGQRHLLAIFAGTIISLVAQPIPMGASVLLAMTLLVLTNTLAPARVLLGFSNANVWMVFSAFIFARAVRVTGLGMRVAYLLIRAFGHSSLTLSYCVAGTNMIMAPFVPSDTGRGGGLIYPIARSLAQAFDSEPGPTASRLGSFLMLVGFHSTYTTSAMFLTGMIANPIAADFAGKIAHADLTWARWALGAIVPGLLALLLIPWLLYRWNPPEIKDTSGARRLAQEELRRMGAISRNEYWLIAILLAVVAGWVTAPWHSIPNAFAALAGVSAMIVTGVLAWNGLLEEYRAWDAVLWFAGLLMMAEEMGRTGVIRIVSEAAFQHLRGWPWLLALTALVAAYLYVHYVFASLTAHTTALYPSFLSAALASGAPPLVAALPLAYFSSLNASTTHYGTGSAPVFFGAGYLSQATWWRLGFLLSLVNLAVWFGVGLVWWKVLGYW